MKKQEPEPHERRLWIVTSHMDGHIGMERGSTDADTRRIFVNYKHHQDPDLFYARLVEELERTPKDQ